MAFVWDIEKRVVFNYGFSKEESQKVENIANMIKEEYFKDLVELTPTRFTNSTDWPKFPNELVDKLYLFDCDEYPLPEDKKIRVQKLCTEINARLYAIDDPFFKYTYTELERGKAWYQVKTSFDKVAYEKYAYKQIIPIINDPNFQAHKDEIGPMIVVRKIEEIASLLEGFFDNRNKNKEIKKEIYNIIKNEMIPSLYKKYNNINSNVFDFFVIENATQNQDYITIIFAESSKEIENFKDIQNDIYKFISKKFYDGFAKCELYKNKEKNIYSIILKISKNSFDKYKEAK